MRYHLDTIPVWDAVKKDCECPFCVLEKNLENSTVEMYLGGSVMEPDVRVKVNETGFCSRHLLMLHSPAGGRKSQNRLGLSLMLNTYIKEHIEKYQKQFNKTIKKTRGRKGKDSILELAKLLENDTNSCMVCERMDEIMQRYAFTYIYLWNNDKEFKEIAHNSRGFCMPHLSLLLNIIAKTQSKSKQQSLTEDILTLQIKNMSRLENELAGFSKKFDYRNSNKDWNNSKDSLKRAIQKLSSNIID